MSTLMPVPPAASGRPRSPRTSLRSNPYGCVTHVRVIRASYLAQELVSRSFRPQVQLAIRGQESTTQRTSNVPVDQRAPEWNEEFDIRVRDYFHDFLTVEMHDGNDDRGGALASAEIPVSKVLPGDPMLITSDLLRGIVNPQRLCTVEMEISIVGIPRDVVQQAGVTTTKKRAAARPTYGIAMRVVSASGGGIPKRASRVQGQVVGCKESVTTAQSENLAWGSEHRLDGFFPGCDVVRLRLMQGDSVVGAGDVRVASLKFGMNETRNVPIYPPISGGRGDRREAAVGSLKVVFNVGERGAEGFVESPWSFDFHQVRIGVVKARGLTRNSAYWVKAGVRPARGSWKTGLATGTEPEWDAAKRAWVNSAERDKVEMQLWEKQGSGDKEIAHVSIPVRSWLQQPEEEVTEYLLELVDPSCGQRVYLVVRHSLEPARSGVEEEDVFEADDPLSSRDSTPAPWKLPGQDGTTTSAGVTEPLSGRARAFAPGDDDGPPPSTGPRLPAQGAEPPVIQSPSGAVGRPRVPRAPGGKAEKAPSGPARAGPESSAQGARQSDAPRDGRGSLQSSRGANRPPPADFLAKSQGAKPSQAKAKPESQPDQAPARHTRAPEGAASERESRSGRRRPSGERASARGAAEAGAGAGQGAAGEIIAGAAPGSARPSGSGSGGGGAIMAGAAPDGGTDRRATRPVAAGAGAQPRARPAHCGFQWGDWGYSYSTSFVGYSDGPSLPPQAEDEKSDPDWHVHDDSEFSGPRVAPLNFLGRVRSIAGQDGSAELTIARTRHGKVLGETCRVRAGGKFEFGAVKQQEKLAFSIGGESVLVKLRQLEAGEHKGHRILLPANRVTINIDYRMQVAA